MGDAPVKTAHLADRPSPQCASEDDQRNLAAGLCPQDQATKLTEHAAKCNHCGPLLRMYAEDFSDDLGQEDERVIRKLKSSSSGWQKKLVSRVLPGSGAVHAKASKSRFSSTWVLIPTAAVACVAIAFAVWYSQRETPEKVEKLLAQAYTEDRSLEMRIPYARHADYHQQRGSERSLLKLPESYREAGSRIASQLKKNPDDSRWLLLGARFDLLDWHYKTALSPLDKIEDVKVADSDEMRTTRALAFYEQAEIEHSPLLLGKVVDLMGKILQKNPNDAVALFNQAVACEKLSMYECASSNWAHLLQVEKDSSWSSEAQQHLNRIKEKTKTRTRVLSWLQDARTAQGELNSGRTISKIQSESYAEIAVNKWLLSGTGQAQEYRQTLLQLARVLARNHGDLWLADFLMARRPKKANRLLALAIDANYRGDSNHAAQNADRARAQYELAGNIAGTSRSEVERIYALRRQSRAKDCIDHVLTLNEHLENRGYRALEVEAAYEQSVCEGMLSNLDAARRFARLRSERPASANYT